MCKTTLYKIASILLTCSIAFSVHATDAIFNGNAATSLSQISLYPDSSFSHNTSIYFGEGTLFEIIDETYFEHEDGSQNQKFKWYQVRASDGQVGWVFGDGLAVIVSDDMIEEELKIFNKKRINLNSGFENAIIWIATVEGRDNFHQQDFLNPPYKENYIVITNSDNRSVHINYGETSARGKKELQQFRVLDITSDGIPEFILESHSVPVSGNTTHRNLNIFSIKAGTIAEIFEERISLSYIDDTPSPALNKIIEIEPGVIRVEYVDFVDCKKYSLPYETGSYKNTCERCTEFVTYTVQWDEQKNAFLSLYEESRSAPNARVIMNGFHLKETPSLTARRIKELRSGDLIKILKHHEKFVVEGGRKKVIPFLYVITPDGDKGFLPAEIVTFIYAEHANLLDSYYKNKPISKTDWNSQQEFVTIKTNQDTSEIIKE